MAELTILVLYFVIDFAETSSIISSSLFTTIDFIVDLYYFFCQKLHELKLLMA